MPLIKFARAAAATTINTLFIHTEPTIHGASPQGVYRVGAVIPRTQVAREEADKLMRRGSRVQRRADREPQVGLITDSPQVGLIADSPQVGLIAASKPRARAGSRWDAPQSRRRSTNRPSAPFAPTALQASSFGHKRPQDALLPVQRLPWAADRG